MGPCQYERWLKNGLANARRMTHTVSGASLSLFSSRYLTSEIKRQPALLNSAKGGKEWG